MSQEIIIPRNFQQSFVYVNERYLFTGENYPVIKELQTHDEVIQFSLNHSLLHIIKNIRHVEPMVVEQNGKTTIVVHSELDKRTLVKQIINICAIAGCFSGFSSNLTKAAEIVEMRTNRFKRSDGNLYDTLLTFIVVVATDLETVDHRGSSDYWSSIENTETEKYLWELLGLMLGLIEEYVPDIWMYIPDYMKSK